MEHKSVTFELKASKSKREIEGYASTYEKDLVGDVIQKGAFTKTIAERLPKNQIKILWQHDQNRPIGRPIHMQEDSKGLYIVGRLTEGVKDADEAIALIQDGVVDTMSIGYDVIKDGLSEDGQTRYLKELRLYEFSPVTFPANPQANIISVTKGLDELLAGINLKELDILTKDGRILSAKNIATIESAVQALTEILDMAKGRAGKDHSHSLEPKEFTLPELDDIKQFIKEIHKRS